MRAAMKSQANSASHIPTFMMDAAKVALECEDSVQEFNVEYRKRRKLMTEGAVIESLSHRNAHEIKQYPFPSHEAQVECLMECD